ncbi:hypothetical protein UY3_15718 [Chelonia mydas]|uniref:Uncharacterized protein n=1 Tax=Chelonia mydas TaxID=8469 RepID=M7AVW1_CHEMY|nr:hypothetical protein UY3_15718 [Chelonia mydas]
MSRGRAWRSPANTEGTVTPVASRGSSRQSAPSLDLRRLQWEKKLKLRELELRRWELQEEQEKQRQEREKQRQHELEEKEKQRQHELELARLRSSETPAAVSDGGPRTARSFDKCLLAQCKVGEDMEDFLDAFETA